MIAVISCESILRIASGSRPKHSDQISIFETVVRCFPLTEELAATEWIGGEVVLQGNKDSLRAYKDGKLLSE